MLGTIALLIVGAAIFVFFAQEFGQFIKKILSIRGMALLLPMLLATWLIMQFQTWIILFLEVCSAVIKLCLAWVDKLMPLSLQGSAITIGFVLAIFSIVPVLVYNALWQRRNFISFPHKDYAISMIWQFFYMVWLLLP